MMHSWPRLVLGLFLGTLTPLGLQAAAPDPDDITFFEKEVRPLLIQRCHACHSVDPEAKIKGGLRLDHRQGWISGGDSGPALVPGNPTESLLVKAVHYRDPDLQMPPKRKLPEAEIAILEQWIRMGAPDPRTSVPEPSDTAASPASSPGSAAARPALWALQAPWPASTKPPAPPDDLPHPANAIDAFLWQHWRDRQASPAPQAAFDRVTRRLTYALTGLPPDLHDLQPSNESPDSRPDARERLADRLLASPRYGERWGRHWLDVARFADSNGMDENKAYTEAYRYRDYVIDAFNRDLPFDRFILQQLAGDLLEDDDPAHKIATGFLAVGPKMLACDDPRKMRMDIVDEQIDTTGRAFLGMTFGCARCHDHKFDPISIQDYYGLAGVFMSTKTLVNYNVVAKWHEYDLSPPEVRQAHQRIATLEKKAKDDQLDEATREAAQREAEELRLDTPPLTKIMGVTENELTDAQVHLRGSYLTLGERVPRGIPAIFTSEDRSPTGSNTDSPTDSITAQSGRLELARWIASPGNPLTARVFANRLWRWHFGQGLVNSTDNFGALGTPPRLRPLLDHLAHELVRGSWSVKRLQRLLVTSARYGLDSQPPPGETEIDPDAVIPAYHPRRRLDAESLRDSLLGLSGSLDLTSGGQLLKDASGSYVNRSHLDDYLEIPRRSVYLPIIRSSLYEAFVAFDMADPSAPNGDRRESVVAPQALFMMNAQEVHLAARSLASGLPEGSASHRLHHLYTRLFYRFPCADDLRQAEHFLQTYTGPDPWPALIRVLFASNEFLYVD